MKKNKAFTLPEILISIGILAVILGAVIGVVNNGERQRREFLGIYNMLVPKLTDMAGYATTLADRPESSGSTWWADSGSLRGLDCEEGTPSYCLREAFIEVARMMRPAARPDDDGFADDGQVNQVLSIIFNQRSGASVSDMRFAEMNEGATLGFLYTDSDCNTILTGRNGEKIRSCGVIVVDVNGKTPPNRMFVPAAQDEPPTNPNLAYDRYIVALTPTSVEQTELINQAANCAQGTVFSNGACVEERTCPLSQTVLDYSAELMRANNERSITRYFPLGEDVNTCFSARCRDGLRPNAENRCNPICDPLDNGEGQQQTPTELSGGLFITEGGILDPLESNVKECCVPISTATQFNNIRNNPNRTYCLVSDIDLKETPWTPIPSFTGKLYGNGHIISNISIDSDANKSSARGLFSQINGGKVVDLELDINYQDTNGSALKAKNWSVGGLSANITNSEIKNVVTQGTITSEGKTGTTST